MVKVANWPQALNTYLNEARVKPFKWGEHDCVTFVLGAVEAITGEPLRNKTWPQWKTRRQALRASNQYDPIAYFINSYQAKLVKPGFQQRGDLGFAKEKVWKGVVFNGLYAWGLDFDGVVLYDAQKFSKTDGLQVVRLL